MCTLPLAGATKVYHTSVLSEPLQVAKVAKAGSSVVAVAFTLLTVVLCAAVGVQFTPSTVMGNAPAGLSLTGACAIATVHTASMAISVAYSLLSSLLLKVMLYFIFKEN